jgi:hypothetical protein
MTTAQIIRLADRRQPRRPAPPPPNPWAEAVAWQLAWTANGARAWAEALEAMSAMWRPPR